MHQRMKKIKLEKEDDYKEEVESDIENQEIKEEESEDDIDESLTHLSPYEKMILKNKQEKMKFLQSLKIDEAQQSFTEAAQKVKPVKKVVRKVYKNHNLIFPRRKSRRLAKLDIDLSEDALFMRAVNEAKTEQTLEGKKIIPAEFSFKEALEDSVESFYSNIRSCLLDSKVDFKPVGYTKTLFKDLKLRGDNVAKVVPTRITSLAIHPHSQNVIVCAGSKYGAIGFWNVLTDSEPLVCHPHSEGITNIKFNPFDASKLISSSYDCTLRCGDMTKEIFEQVHASDEASLTYFDFLSATVILVSQKNGQVSIVDTRSRAKHTVSHSCHEYSAKTVSIHPQEKSYFVSSDTKGFIRVWDLRKLQKQPLVDIHHHKRSINSAFFSPLTGKYILSTSLDDTVALFDSSVISKDISLKISNRHNNWTGRWLTPFRATWLCNSDEYFVIGSMSPERRIEVFNSEIKNVHNFIDENLSSICSVNVFHPNRPVLAGANSSGKVFVFMK